MLTETQQTNPLPINYCDSTMEAQIENRFTYHAPKTDQLPRYKEIRDTAKELALVIARTVPPSREQSLALTHLQLCTMLANSGIACNE